MFGQIGHLLFGYQHAQEAVRSCGREGLASVGPYVVLDLETTGLDPHRDAIIQVALKRSDGVQWASFVNPGRVVPPAILALTGFEAVDFSDVPQFADIRDTVQELLDGFRVVGHNVRFDLAFLARMGLSVPGDPLDTLEWGRLAFPLRSHYGLGDWFSDQAERLHDARVDVDLTERLLWQIAAALRTFSLPLSRDLARILGAEWDWWDVEPNETGHLSRLYAPESDNFEAAPLSVTSHADTASAWLGPQGRLTEDPSFESRPAQAAMAEAWEMALEQGQILLAEAGTGTGKSLAYLVPAILQSVKQGVRTVVATHTVALQEQLWLKDIPQVARDWPVRVAMVKGRGRYLCLYKASEVLQEAAVLGDTRDRRWALASLLSYIEASEAGDQDEFGARGDTARALWQEVKADSHSCIGSRCPYAGVCFMRQARHQAESSHLVVVNHALLAAHVASGNILPEFDYLVVDEAHHLAEVLEKALGFELDQEEWEKRFRESVHPRRGLFGRLMAFSEVSGSVARLRELYQVMSERLAGLEAGLAALTPAGEYDLRSVRITQDGYEMLEQAGLIQQWREVLHETNRLVDQGADLLSEAEAWGWAEQPIWLRYRQWHQDLSDFSFGLSRWAELSADRVAWWEVRTGRGGEPVVTLRWAPVDVAPIARENLWDTITGGMLTSATLAVGGRFQYVADALGIPMERRTGQLFSSPFDWQRQARLILPTDSPDPRDPLYLERLAECVADVAETRQGRTLVLLTSYRAVQSVCWALRGRLESAGIRVLAQNIDGPARRLVAEFRRSPAAVLIGTATYWEGVDIPGRDLEVVVIGRLPFRAPGDPLEEAKWERIRQNGQSPFYKRSLPEAILRFQQGFGRLIRTRTDRGVAIVFDPRVRQARYGRLFLDTLAQVPRVEVPCQVVSDVVQQFLGGCE